MNNNEQKISEDSFSTKICSNGITSKLSSVDISEEKFDWNPESKENQNQNQDQNQTQEKTDDDEFIRITAAHQMLIEAQTCDEQENYSLALHLYRICVDFLLEELMFANGTERSRIYLREKCAAIMDRIDILKTKLDPILSSVITQSSTDDLPVDQLKSLDIS